MKSSKLSESLYSANVPDVLNFSAVFVYNFYEKTERTRKDVFGGNSNSLPLDKCPRYVSLNWDLPVRKTYTYQNTQPKNSKGSDNLSPSISSVTFSNFNFGSSSETVDTILPKIVSEDDDFSPYFTSQNFSDISSITQGALDLKLYSTLINSNIVSNNKKQKDLLQSIVNDNQIDIMSQDFQENLKKITDAYDAVSDFPSDLLGLNVYEKEGQNLVETDDRGFMKTLSNSLLINYKMHNLVLPDFFANEESLKYPEIYKKFNEAVENSKLPKDEGPKIFAFKKNEIDPTTPFAPQVTKITTVKGYLIYKYRVDINGIVQDDIFYINDGQKNTFTDREILYGKTYIYSISVVCELDLLGKIEDDNNKLTDDYDLMTVNLASRQSSAAVECIEFSPPPPPADINFIFDYVNRNLIAHWDFPVNPQSDITQFQVLRRKSLNEPFELIAQYGFDKSSLAQNDEKYLTGEKVDVNNIAKMSEDLRTLAIESPGPVYRHVDKDFVVDTEFFESTTFIYAFCSVDAHGMISNYSAQYEVTFDPFKNKLVTKVICDEGSPRSYPNMNLKIDAFKDSINVYGDQTKKIDFYFSPEYLKVQSELGKQFNVFETNENLFDGNGSDEDSFYLLQMINLDNQKIQSVKFKVFNPPKPEPPPPPIPVPIPNLPPKEPLPISPIDPNFNAKQMLEIAKKLKYKIVAPPDKFINPKPKIPPKL